ncbi:hypothetical protein BDW22DRAFT_745525 [Trametopsis cervina]|nr:hypothetical protein BDW22DRAFT_745525 [Trametopsis cervina]
MAWPMPKLGTLPMTYPQDRLLSASAVSWSSTVQSVRARAGSGSDCPAVLCQHMPIQISPGPTPYPAHWRRHSFHDHCARLSCTAAAAWSHDRRSARSPPRLRCRLAASFNHRKPLTISLQRAAP